MGGLAGGGGLRGSSLVGVKAVAVGLLSLPVGFLAFLLLVWTLVAMFALAGGGVAGCENFSPPVVGVGRSL